MGHVFVSYSNNDIEITNQIMQHLKDSGFDVWVDREEIKESNFWRVEIVEAIDDADAVVLMLSPNSAASDNMRREVDLAEESNRRLFPVLLAAVTLPPQLRHQLAGIQWVDYGSDPERKLRELVDVLKAHQKRIVDSKRSEATTRLVEVVIDGVDFAEFGTKEQEKLLNYIAEVTVTPRAQLSLIGLSAGSVHAFIRMPAHSAYVLKTAAMNRNQSLLDYGVDTIQLKGDQNYVSVRTGEFMPIKAKPRSLFLTSSVAIWIGVAIVAAILVAQILSPMLSPALILPTLTATITITPRNKPTETPSITPTPSMTATPTATRTATLSPTPTETLLPSAKVLFDFVDQAKSAIWNNCAERSCDVSASGAALKFDAPEPAKEGFAVYVDQAFTVFHKRDLEDKGPYNFFLSTHPKWVPEGGVRGFYDLSSVVIQHGDRFTSKVGFVEGANASDGVTYRLLFSPGKTQPGSPDNPSYSYIIIGEHTHLYEGQLDEWSLTLPESMAGQSGWFILEVDAGKSPYYDWAAWAEARLMRP